MCLGLCQCLIESLPYVTVVALPLLGAFLGVEVVLRISLLLGLHAAIISVLPKPWISFLPYLQAMVFVSLAVCPMVWLPWPVVWLYGLLMGLSEPLLLVAEVVLMLNVVMRCGQRLAEKIDDEEDTSLCKGIIIIFSAACYAVAGSGAWELYKNNTSLQNILLLIVILLFVAVHNMFWMAREGVISDAAFCTLCMVSVLGAMSLETRYIRNPLDEPVEWRSYPYFNQPEHALFDTLASFGRLEWVGQLPHTEPHTGLSRHSLGFISPQEVEKIMLMKQPTRGDTALLPGSRGVVFLLNVVVTPFFFLSVAIRLYSIIFIISKITKNFFLNEEEGELTFLDEDELMDPMAPWRSPLLLKLSIIYMLTQLTVHFLWQASGHYTALLTHWVPVLVQNVWPQQLLLGRLGQVVAVCAFYIWRLYCADAWTWCEWLTP